MCLLSANVPRGYTCACHKGFLLDSDGTNCSSGMLAFKLETIIELIDNTGTTSPSTAAPLEHGINFSTS